MINPQLCCIEHVQKLCKFFRLKLIHCLLAITFCMISQTSYASEQPSKKRYIEPGPLPSIEVDGIQYQALRWGKERDLGQNGGYIVAIDSSTNTELWLLKVYDVKYDNEMEADKQDVFITKISKKWFWDILKIEDEKGRSYEVDLDSRKVRVLAD